MPLPEYPKLKQQNNNRNRLRILRKILTAMIINYDSKTDLLYIRLDEKKHPLTNRRVNEDVVLDIDEKGKIVGIEIMSASQNVDLTTLLPVEIKKAS